MDNCSKLLSEIDQYDMSTNPLGKAYIFNNKTFKDKKGERSGTECDKRALTDLFETMGFKTTTFDDLSCSDFIEELDNISKEDFSKYACFLAVFLSHGKEDKIMMKDTTVDEEEIFKRLFQEQEGLGLFGKPKIFIFQACRGERENKGIKRKSVLAQATGDIERDALKEKKESEWVARVPASADFIKCYATPHGYLSYRSPDTDSWFIQTLVQVLDEYINDETEVTIDFTTLLKIVANKVSKMGSKDKKKKEEEPTDGKCMQEKEPTDDKNQMKMQMPCTVTTLTKKLFFPKSKKTEYN